MPPPWSRSAAGSTGCRWRWSWRPAAAAGEARMVAYFVDYVAAHPADYAACDREAPNILAALGLAATQGRTDALVRGANAFYHFMETRGWYEVARAQLARAAGAAR